MQYDRHDRLPDQGWIGDQPVVNVRCKHLGDVVHHHEGSESSFRVGEQVRIRVDHQHRQLQSRLLCAGRVIELVGPKVMPGLRVIESDFRPNRAKVEFGDPEYIPSAATVFSQLSKEVERLLSLDLSVITTAIANGPFCYVQIGDFERIKCTGLYPKSLKKIGNISINRVITIGGRLQVRFGVN